MKSLLENVTLLSAAVFAAGLLCCVGSYLTSGPIGVEGALLASLVTWFAGVLVLLLTTRLGASPAGVLAGTSVRLGVVALAAFTIYKIHGGLDQRSFVLSVGVTYLAALAVETWVALKSKPVSFSHFFKSRVEA